MNRILRTGAVVGLLLLANVASGRDEAMPPDERPDAQPRRDTDQSVREAKAFTEWAAVEARLWKLTLENDDRTVATDQKAPVLNWSWSDNGRYYGNVHVFTAHGRPVAIVKYFEWFSPIEGVFFQCTSLTNVPLTATRDGQEIWAPRNNNVVMRDVPDAPAPAVTPAARLVQMRRIAEVFKVELDDKRGTEAYTTRQLRLMSRPIFRYGDKEGEVVDGALFAYAVSADPGALLILEAVRSKNDVRWQFGFPRAWSFSGRAEYAGQRVWEIEEVNLRADPKSNFYLNALPRTAK